MLYLILFVLFLLKIVTKLGMDVISEAVNVSVPQPDNGVSATASDTRNLRFVNVIFNNR